MTGDAAAARRRARQAQVMARCRDAVAAGRITTDQLLETAFHQLRARPAAYDAALGTLAAEVTRTPEE